MPHAQLGMTTAQALILGIMEGITEYLPVSSTGHLYLVQRLIGVGNSATAREAADSYVIAVQIGAILAVLWLYWSRVREVAQGVLGGTSADVFLPATSRRLSSPRPLLASSWNQS